MFHCLHVASEKISENLHIIGNDPSLAFYRMQEHIRRGKHFKLRSRYIYAFIDWQWCDDCQLAPTSLPLPPLVTIFLFFSDANDSGASSRSWTSSTRVTRPLLRPRIFFEVGKTKDLFIDFSCYLWEYTVVSNMDVILQCNQIGR